MLFTVFLAGVDGEGGQGRRGGNIIPWGLAFGGEARAYFLLFIT